MERILKDINAVVGVTGSFVCNENGQVVAKLTPDTFSDDLLHPIGRTLTQTIAGLKIARRRKVGDIDLLYDQGRLIVKGVGDGCLCILCVKRINVPLLNLTANVAVKKLQEEIDKAIPLRSTQPAARATEEETPEESKDEAKPETNQKMTLAELMASNLRY